MRDSHLWLVCNPPEPEPERRVRTLVPALSPDGPVPHDVDLQLGRLARQANIDPAALDTLYAAYRPRLDHWVRRATRSCYRPGADPAIEPADFDQQAFVVFADLVLAWNERGSLSAYLIALFPWKLSDAVRRMSDQRGRRSLDDSSTLLSDGSHAADESIALLEALAADLPGRQGQVLLFRIRDGLTWSEIADRIGLDMRTGQRDLRAALRLIRASLDQPTRGKSSY